MLDIAKPKIEVIAAEENYGRFKIEPLEPGYGHTLGNSLRRVLLSSIPGAAITKVKIEGVYHEFSTIPGVREDVTEIVLNIKGIRLRSFATRRIRVTLMHQGAGPVYAKHIDMPSNVELVNPDHYICTLDSNDARIEMEFTVEVGRGYIPAEMNEVAAIGEIPIDAIFTPIPKVNYFVENTRVQQATNFDRLVIEIFTDGTIKPGDALIHAAQVLVEYNQIIASFSREKIDVEVTMDSPDRLKQGDSTNAIPQQIMDMPVDALELSTRTHNCLRRADIATIGQILQMDEKQLKAVRNLGDKSLEEIKDRVREKCARHGYDLGGKWAASDATRVDTTEVE
jgi:DNA-directed RNA polymerase subunit alpha